MSVTEQKRTHKGDWPPVPWMFLGSPFVGNYQNRNEPPGMARPSV